jgi:hypothetical protein
MSAATASIRAQKKQGRQTPWITRKHHEEIVRKLTERAERAESRMHDLGVVGNRARDREAKICHQLGKMIHWVFCLRDDPPDFSFDSRKWHELLREAEAADRLLKS